jgi:hypothetical protein
MEDPDFRQLMGIVEADETYIGGSGRTARRLHGKRFGRKRGGGAVGKIPVIGAIVAGHRRLPDGRECRRRNAAEFVRETHPTGLRLVATDQHRVTRDSMSAARERGSR